MYVLQSITHIGKCTELYRVEQFLEYSQRTETGQPSVPPGYPRVLCFRGGHCRGRGFPPQPPPKGGTPCPDSAAPRGARVLLARPADRAKTVHTARKQFISKTIHFKK